MCKLRGFLPCVFLCSSEGTDVGVLRSHLQPSPTLAEEGHHARAGMSTPQCSISQSANIQGRDVCACVYHSTSQSSAFIQCTVFIVTALSPSCSTFSRMH